MKRFLLPIILIIFLFYSCSNSADFSEYSGINLISSSNTWAENTDSADYTNYETVSDSTYSDAARLEILNLIPNGDFDSTALSDYHWNETGSETHSIAAVNGNNKLSFDTISQTGYIYFDLSGISPAPSEGESYIFKVNCIKTSPDYLYFSYNDGTNYYSSSNWTATITSNNLEYTFPDDFNSGTEVNTTFTIESGTKQYFSIGSPDLASQFEAQTGYIDDIRLTRDDLDMGIFTELSYSDANRTDNLKLISGTYTFSVYVKRDSTAGSSNRFASEDVELGIITIDDTHKEVFLDSSSWTDWTLIQTSSFFQTDETVDPIFILYISPSSTSPNDITVGSILIANPRLEYSDS